MARVCQVTGKGPMVGNHVSLIDKVGIEQVVADLRARGEI
jgi:ribosomal protein L28